MCLITLSDGAKDPEYCFRFPQYDFIQTGMVNTGNNFERLIDKVACTKDGSAAFVVKELMELYSESEAEIKAWEAENISNYLGDGDYRVRCPLGQLRQKFVDSIRDFIRDMHAIRLDRWGELPCGHTNSVGAYNWKRADLQAFQAYKDNQRSWCGV